MKSACSAIVALATAWLGVCATARAQTGVLTVSGGSQSQTGQAYAATAVDQSAVYALSSAQVTLTGCVMTKTGDASNVSNASQYGTNAGVLAKSNADVTVAGGSVTTNASGANGLFATGTGSSITMSDGVIDANGGNAHGVDVTYGGAITLANVDVTTSGASSSAIATDFGGGTVTVTGGTIAANAASAGSHSAGIYSTGVISVTGATVSSAADCGGVIDGANSIILTSTSLTGALEGIKIWKTAPAAGPATVTITGGSLTAATGSGILVTGATGNAATANVTVTGGAVISAGSGNLLSVVGSSAATFTVGASALTGCVRADDTSTVAVTLQAGAALTGALLRVGLAMDASSTWNVTANSILTSAVDPTGLSGLTVTNIVGNGHDVHYDADLAANSYLGGLTYALVNGGRLTPDAVTGAEARSWGGLKNDYR